MKLKYFLRGLGAGILLTAIVMSFPNNMGKENKMTDAQIKQAAKNLGMVDEKDSLDENLDQLKEEDTATPEPTKEPDAEPTKTPDVTKEPSVEKEEEPSVKPSEEPVNEVTYATITITDGMYSGRVSSLLEQTGVISDSKAFDEYLIENEYQTKILQGTYDIPIGASFDEIAKKITR